MLGIMWGIGDIAKIIENLQVLMNFHGLGGPSWSHFLMFLGCLFQDRFLIVLGSVLGSSFKLCGVPKGVGFEGFAGLFWGRFWDSSWGGTGTL